MQRSASFSCARARRLWARAACGLALAALSISVPAAEATRSRHANADYQLVHSFVGADGFKSQSALIASGDGQLIGTAFGGGAIGQGDGTAFRLAADGRLTVVHSFDGRRGGEGPVGLTRAHDGNFYGVTTRGGHYLQGTAYRMSPQGEVTVLHSFQQDGNDGSTPQAPLLQASDGQFYGTTSYGGRHGWGSVFRLTAQGQLTVLHSFDNDGHDGHGPGQASLIQARDGELYGSTQGGGEHGLGTVFRLRADGSLTVLHSFQGPDGRAPSSALIEAPDGQFYGVTAGGGAYRRGTVYRLGRDGGVTVLHAFSGRHGDGADPAGDLLLARDGRLYGVTQRGGRYDGGTVYRIGLDGTFSRLHSFNPAGPDGHMPWAGLVETNDGEFYGSTYQGGAHDAGGIFRITAR